MVSTEAIQLAIDSCIDQNILRDVLIKQKTEVLHMLWTEFNEKAYKKGIYQEGYEAGEQAGFQKGEDHTMQELVRAKLARGKSAQTIAEELETDVFHIEEIIQTIHAKK